MKDYEEWPGRSGKKQMTIWLFSRNLKMENVEIKSWIERLRYGWIRAEERTGKMETICDNYSEGNTER